MEKINRTSWDIAKDNIEKIKDLFPCVVTEGKIDFDSLRMLLSDEIDERTEKYQFTWPGKKESIKIAQLPSNTTLRPMQEKSKNWNKTNNIYIEGDNLEVLKQLQKTYYGKIKMVYIDPPYNTGGDFVYKDNFTNSIKNYTEQSNQPLKSNPETSGRFHTNWLNMMYPRLILARNLLTQDGIVFISIDDVELSNLKKICDEVFGESNFITTICVETSNGLFGLKAKFATSTIVKSKDYVLVYKKSEVNLDINPLRTKSKYEFDSHFTWYKNDEYECSLNEFLKNNRLIASKASLLGIAPNIGNLHRLMSIFDEVRELILSEKDHIFRIREYTLKTTQEQYELLKDKKKHLIEDLWVFMDQDDHLQYLYPFSKLISKSDDYDSTICSCVIQGDLWKGFNDDMGNIGKEGEVPFPNGKKPVRLIKNMCKLINDRDFIVLDFFSGSATTAEAIMRINLEDGGDRKFIMVQLPETCEKKSEAYKTGFKTICDIGEERIRRAGEKIKKEWEEKNRSAGLFAEEKEFPVDIGFKVFKLDSTNIKPWDNENELDEESLFTLDHVFKEGRTKEDVLYEIMLKYGIFDQPVTEIDINGKIMYRIGRRHMIVCLEDNVTEKDINAISDMSPRVVVFKEAGFKDDNQKINAEYNLKKAGVEDVKCV